jgi:hypothetical protein
MFAIVAIMRREEYAVTQPKATCSTLHAVLALTIALLTPAAAGATEFAVENWSIAWQDPDLDGVPNPIVWLDDFGDGNFDGAPSPDCSTLLTRYCEISGEVQDGDESGGLLMLRNPSFNAVSNQIDQFLFLNDFHPGPMTTIVRYIFDVPGTGDSYWLQVFSALPGGDFEQLGVFLARGAPGTPAVTNLFAGILDVKRDVILTFLDLGAADSIHASTFDLELRLIPAGSVLRPEACIRFDAGSCMALDVSGAPDLPGSAPTTAIIGVVPSQLVDIDIKPGNDANFIKQGRGAVAVALLGSDTFDVADVDVTTLAFGPGGAPLAHRNGPHVKDANHDGFTDLVGHYRLAESGIAAGDISACLTGELLDGTPFKGCDAVTTLK